MDLLWLTASSMRNTFLPIFVTICDAQNQPNHCNLYASVFPVEAIHRGIELCERPLRRFCASPKVKKIRRNLFPLLDAFSLSHCEKYMLHIKPLPFSLPETIHPHHDINANAFYRLQSKGDNMFGSVCLSVCLSICPSVCLSVRPSVHLRTL